MKITNKNGLREYGKENNCLNVIFLHNKILIMITNMN